MPSFDIAALNSQVVSDAWLESEKINSRLDADRAKKLKKAEAQLAEQSAKKVAAETERAKSASQRRLSDCATENKRSLIALRSRMEKELFDALLQQLQAFTASPAYLPFLTAKLEALQKTPGGEKVILYIRPEDEKAAAEAAQRAGLDCEIRPDRGILHGGARIFLPGQGVMMDSTIDLALEGQREWFRQHSHLTISQ